MVEKRTRRLEYPELDEMILEGVDYWIQRTKHIFEEYDLEPHAQARSVVHWVQAQYDKKFRTDISKMTIWRHIHQLEALGKIILKKEPIPIPIEMITIRKP